MIQKPLSLPLVVPLPPNCNLLSLQNLHVEMTTLSRWYELMVHQTINVKEFQELSDFLSYFQQYNMAICILEFFPVETHCETFVVCFAGAVDLHNNCNGGS
jgi:hypothetical protein